MSDLVAMTTKLLNIFGPKRVSMSWKDFYS